MSRSRPRVFCRALCCHLRLNSILEPEWRTLRPGRDRRRPRRVRRRDPRRPARHEGRLRREAAGKALGGTCLNVGCIPSKALLDSSELYDVAPAQARHATASRSASVDARPRRDARPQGRGRQGADRRRRLPVQEEQGRRRSTAPASCSAGDKVEVTGDDGTKTTLEAEARPARHRQRADRAAVPARSTASTSSARPRRWPSTAVPEAPDRRRRRLHRPGARLGLDAARGEGDGPRVPAAHPAARRRRGRRRWCTSRSTKQGLEFHLETQGDRARRSQGDAVTVTAAGEGRQGADVRRATACWSRSAGGRTPPGSGWTRPA